MALITIIAFFVDDSSCIGTDFSLPSTYSWKKIFTHTNEGTVRGGKNIIFILPVYSRKKQGKLIS